MSRHWRDTLLTWQLSHSVEGATSSKVRKIIPMVCRRNEDSVATNKIDKSKDQRACNEELSTVNKDEAAFNEKISTVNKDQADCNGKISSDNKDQADCNERLSDFSIDEAVCKGTVVCDENIVNYHVTIEDMLFPVQPTDSVQVRKDKAFDWMKR